MARRRSRALTPHKKRRTKEGAKLASDAQIARQAVARANKAMRKEKEVANDDNDENDTLDNRPNALQLSPRRKRRPSRARPRSPARQAQKGPPRRTPGDSRSLRCVVADVYSILGFPEPKEEYKGEKDVATYIHKMLGFPQGSTAMTKQVVQQCHTCYLVGDEWDYDTHSNMDMCGRKCEIELEPGELQIIAHFYQKGNSIQMVHQVFNDWRQDFKDKNGNPKPRSPVTEYTIRYAVDFPCGGANTHQLHHKACSQVPS